MRMTIGLPISARASLLAVLITAVCAPGWTQTPAAHTADSEPAPANTEKATILDPSMQGMKAIEVTYPAGWHFNGDLFLTGVPGQHFVSDTDDCGLGPTAVFRATSPDGLSFIEQWPLAVWGWSNGSKDAWYSGAKCYPLHGPISAQEYLKYVAAMLNVEYLGDLAPNAAESGNAAKTVQDANERDAARKPGGKEPATHWKMEMAEGMVGFVNGTFRMKGRLTVQLIYSETTFPEGLDYDQKKKPKTATVMDRCQARVFFVVAPEDRLAAVLSQWDRPGMGPRRLQEWEQALAMRSRSDDLRNDRNGFIRSERLLSWRGDFERTQRVREQMYAQFEAIYKLGLEKAQAQAAALANSKHQIAQDWTDLQLDNPNAAESATNDQVGEAKQLSVLATTWTESNSGKDFQTRDLRADPNGILPGMWTSARPAQAAPRPQ